MPINDGSIGDKSPFFLISGLLFCDVNSIEVSVYCLKNVSNDAFVFCYSRRKVFQIRARLIRLIVPVWSPSELLNSLKLVSALRGELSAVTDVLLLNY